MQYFDVEAKIWKPLASTMPLKEATQCYCAASAGSKLYVAVIERNGHYIYRYHAEGNEWEKQSHWCNVINNLCINEDYMYAVSRYWNYVPQRYNFASHQWQSFARVSITLPGSVYLCGATLLHSKVYVLYCSQSYVSGGYESQNAVLHCLYPEMNKWEVKATTCHPHFGSTLFVVNNRLYVIGGCISFDGQPCGNVAPVELYNEVSNTWSVVEQDHIPPNNLGAVEIEGRVYFIINKFPIDSGVRISPGEFYPLPLGEWEN